MAGKQEYNQVCPVASALDVIGSRWALLVVRELALGPRRFGDIHAGLETASTDMLTSRLRELEAAGLVERTDDRRYQMTAAGLALGPVMRSMMVWSLQTGAIDGIGADGSPRSFGPDPLRRVMGLLSLIAHTTPLDAAAGDVTLIAEELTTTVSPGPVGYRITQGTPPTSAGTITMSSDALIALVIGGAPIEPRLSTEQITADTPAAQHVLDQLASATAAIHAEIAQPVS